MKSIIVFCGEAGAGKDTAAAYITKPHGACIGQADVLKRIVTDIFEDFTDVHLWGPSAARNEIVPINWTRACQAMLACGRQWCAKIFPDKETEAFDKLKNQWFVSCIRAATADGKISSRYLLQTLGTEWGRSIDCDIWIKYALNTAEQILGSHLFYDRKTGAREGHYQCPIVAITDGRFINEIQEAKKRGAYTIRILRDQNLTDDAQKAGIAGHSSETEIAKIPNSFFDFLVYNNSTITQLKTTLNIILNRLQQPK